MNTNAEPTPVVPRDDLALVDPRSRSTLTSLGTSLVLMYSANRTSYLLIDSGTRLIYAQAPAIIPTMGTKKESLPRISG